MNLKDLQQLHEATALFYEVFFSSKRQTSKIEYNTAIAALGLTRGAFKAMIRLLVICDLITVDGDTFVVTQDQLQQQRQLLKHFTYQEKKEAQALIRKALSKRDFFFNEISDIEYEIYSRCNFAVTNDLGHAIANSLDLNGSNILELGGNSGGLGAAIKAKYPTCSYAVVDTKIPCAIGKEFSRQNNTRIQFIEDDIFTLSKINQTYDTIILMNLLHDFEDKKCLRIIKNCIDHATTNTPIIVIEDILKGEYDPAEVVLHGLRLSIECRGGKQRTIDEFIDMFAVFDFKLDKKIRLTPVHSLLAFSLAQ